MNKSFLNQAIILIVISVVLSPSIYFLFFATYTNDQIGFYRLMSYVVLPLPALASMVCLALGLGRLYAAKTQPPTTVGYVPAGATGQRSKEYRRKRNNLIALVVVTVLLSVVGLLMLFVIVYLVKQNFIWLIFPGMIPVAIFLLACILVPLNIKNIVKQKKILHGIERS